MGFRESTLSSNNALDRKMKVMEDDLLEEMEMEESIGESDATKIDTPTSPSFDTTAINSPTNLDSKHSTKRSLFRRDTRSPNSSRKYNLFSSPSSKSPDRGQKAKKSKKSKKPKKAYRS